MHTARRYFSVLHQRRRLTVDWGGGGDANTVQSGLLSTLFVEIFARTNFRTFRQRENRNIRTDLFLRTFHKVQNSVLIFAQFRTNFWPKQLFCIAFSKC